jgi:hypothetical protein
MEWGTDREGACVGEGPVLFLSGEGREKKSSDAVNEQWRGWRRRKIGEPHEPPYDGNCRWRVPVPA